MRTPTEKQYEQLLALGAGSAGLSWRKRSTDSLLRWGWVTAEWDEPFYQWVRITPAGLIALAAAVEKYGLPDLGPAPKTRHRVCSKCDSTRWHWEFTEVDGVPADQGEGR